MSTITRSSRFLIGALIAGTLLGGGATTVASAAGNEVTAASPEQGRQISLPQGREIGVKELGREVRGASSVAASGWVEVRTEADGVRIRTRPVDGTVVGLISKGTIFYVSCKRLARDGFAWGYAKRGGTYGWVREDLWYEVQYTGPGGGSSPRVPWCW